jgi:hypothetical protein
MIFALKTVLLAQARIYNIYPKSLGSMAHACMLWVPVILGNAENDGF